MKFEIQYAKRADGAKTALGTMGSGPYLVVPPGWVSHLDRVQGDPVERAFLERLAEHNTVVFYDKHGCGLSDRNRTDFTLEDDLLDLDAVAEHLAVTRFALFGNSSGGSMSLLYAARHPETVTRLALYGTSAGIAPGEHPRFEATKAALAGLIRANWGLASKALADVFYPKGVDLETRERYARFERTAATGEMAATLLERAEFETDLRPLLPEITAPALVLHRRGDQAVPFNAGRELAMLLPNARFVPLEGDIHVPAEGDTESVLRPLLEFLSEAGEPDAKLPSGITAILFLDIAGSTELTTKLGDAAYRERERELDASLRSAITEAGGTPVEGKVLCDGVMAVFTSARQAILAAQHCRDLGNEADLPLHLGIHAGDVVREGNNVHGGAVQVASRVQNAAEPGEILVSATVRDLARTSAGVAFEDRGEHEMKGIPEPQRLFAVTEQD